MPAASPDKERNLAAASIVRSYPQTVENQAELAVFLPEAETFRRNGAVNFKKTRRTVINYSHIAATVDEVAEIAKGYGVKLAYENVHCCIFQQP